MLSNYFHITRNRIFQGLVLHLAIKIKYRLTVSDLQLLLKVPIQVDLIQAFPPNVNCVGQPHAVLVRREVYVLRNKV